MRKRGCCGAVCVLREAARTAKLDAWHERVESASLRASMRSTFSERTMGPRTMGAIAGYHAGGDLGSTWGSQPF